MSRRSRTSCNDSSHCMPTKNRDALAMLCLTGARLSIVEPHFCLSCLIRTVHLCTQSMKRRNVKIEKDERYPFLDIMALRISQASRNAPFSRDKTITVTVVRGVLVEY